jgi:integrase
LSYTGIRWTEALTLKWSDINFDRREITIQSKPEIDFSPKSGRSRVIPIHSELYEILESNFENRKGEWLFCNESGQRVKSMRKSFTKACERAKLGEGVTPHSLRHSFATLMLQNGVDVKTLSVILGHKNPNITLNIYCHYIPSFGKVAIGQLPAFDSDLGAVVPFRGKSTG